MMQPVRLCVGGEWHRYPSSFYIPNDKIEVSFLRSDFHGQLPQPFAVRFLRVLLVVFPSVVKERQTCRAVVQELA